MFITVKAGAEQLMDAFHESDVVFTDVSTLRMNDDVISLTKVSYCDSTVFKDCPQGPL